MTSQLDFDERQAAFEEAAKNGAYSVAELTQLAFLSEIAKQLIRIADALERANDEHGELVQ